MSQPVKVGRESTHGTVTSTFYPAAVNFDANAVVANLIPEEQRGGQDINFTVIPGKKYEKWSVKDSYCYHDSLGFFLMSILGLPVSTLSETGVYDSVFKFLDDPTSLSFQWTQPRRSVQGYQALWAVADKLTLSFDIGGQLMFSCDGVAMTETEVATPTFSFTTAIPWSVWAGTVTLGGGAFSRLKKGSITFSRNRNPFWTINNSTDPIDMSIGNRTVDFDLTVDFNTKAEYDRYKAGSTTTLQIVWVDNANLIGATNKPTLTVKCGTIGYESGELDTGEDFPALNIKGGAVYNSGDASTAIVTLRANRQYQTV